MFDNVFCRGVGSIASPKFPCACALPAHSCDMTYEKENDACSPSAPPGQIGPSYPVNLTKYIVDMFYARKIQSETLCNFIRPTVQVMKNASKLGNNNELRDIEIRVLVELYANSPFIFIRLDFCIRPHDNHLIALNFALTTRSRLQFPVQLRVIQSAECMSAKRPSFLLLLDMHACAFWNGRTKLRGEDR